MRKKPARRPGRHDGGLRLSVELDRTEVGVLRLLQEDGRMSFVEMADRLGVAEATVRR
ncbi:MAG TPA: AsnC family transcriptional regulator, partial [Bacillota bacterium]